MAFLRSYTCGYILKAAAADVKRRLKMKMLPWPGALP